MKLSEKNYSHFCNFVLNTDLLAYLPLQLESVTAHRLLGKMHSAVLFWPPDFGNKFCVSNTTKVETKVKY